MSPAPIAEKQEKPAKPGKAAKQEPTQENARTQAPRAEPDVTVHDDVDNSIFSRPSHEEICILAYSYWLERGQPDGSAEEDWLRAENELNQRRSANPSSDTSRT